MAEAIIPRRTINKQEYILLADITVSSATTNVDIAGLNIGKEDEILMVVDFNNLGTGSLVTFFNGNNTLTNYYIQRILADGTGVTSVRANNPILIGNQGVAKGQLFANIKLTNNGYIVAQGHTNVAYNTNSIKIYDSYMTSTFTATSITSIRISVSTTPSSDIGIGSRITIYKAGA